MLAEIRRIIDRCRTRRQEAEAEERDRQRLAEQVRQDWKNRGIRMNYSTCTLQYGDFWQDTQRSGDWNLYYFMFSEVPPSGELTAEGVEKLKRLLEKVDGIEPEDDGDPYAPIAAGKDAERVYRMYGIGQKAEHGEWAKRDLSLLYTFLRTQRRTHETADGTVYSDYSVKGETLRDCSRELKAIFRQFGDPSTMTKRDLLENKIKDLEQENSVLKEENTQLKIRLEQSGAELRQAKHAYWKIRENRDTDREQHESEVSKLKSKNESLCRYIRDQTWVIPAGMECAHDEYGLDD